MASQDRLDALFFEIKYCDIICLQEVNLNDAFHDLIDKMENEGFGYVIEESDNKSFQLLCTFFNTKKMNLKNHDLQIINNNYILETEFSVNVINDNTPFMVYNVYFNHLQDKYALESKIKSLKHIQKNTNPHILCGDFNSVRELDYSNKKQWEWIVQNRNDRDVADINANLFTEATDHYISAITHTKEYILEKFIYTVWSMRVIDHIFIANNDNWKIHKSNIYYPVYKYKNETRPLSDHLPLIAEILIPTDSQRYFIDCLDKLSSKKNYKDVIIKKNSVLYHGTSLNIPDNMLRDNSFLSNRLKFANHWAIQKSKNYGNTNTPIIYKFSTKRDLKLLLLDANPSYECDGGYCVGEGSNKKSLKCSNSFQCVEQPGFQGFGNLYYKNCADERILNLLLAENVLNQDQFLELLCLYTDYDGFKWTQHEQEIAICKPNKVLKFEGVSVKKLNNKPERDDDFDMLEEADEMKKKQTYYTNWSK